MNPLRAKMVRHSKNYLWSSYTFKTEGKQDELLDEDPVYLGLGKTPKERPAIYKEWLERSVPHEELSLIRNATHQGGIFGNKELFGRLLNG